MVDCANCGLEARTGDRYCRRCGAALGAGPDAPTLAVPGARHGLAGDPTSVVPVVPHLPGDPSPPARPGPTGPGPSVAAQPTIMVRPRRAGRGLVVTACVLVALLAVGVGVLASGVLHRTGAGPAPAPATNPPVTRSTPHHRTGTPTTSSSTSAPTTTSTTSAAELSQAQAISAIATQSGSARASVQNAVADIGGCGPNMAADVTTLQNEAAARTQLASQLGGLAVGSVPNGPALVAALTQALQASAAADTAYAAWGHGAIGCSGTAPQDANAAAAAAADEQASTAKQTFANDWAPLAQALGLPALSPDQI